MITIPELKTYMCLFVYETLPLKNRKVTNDLIYDQLVRKTTPRTLLNPLQNLFLTCWMHFYQSLCKVCKANLIFPLELDMLLDEIKKPPCSSVRLYTKSKLKNKKNMN